ASLALRFRHDHLAHGHNAVFFKEHVLGPAQPNAFGTKLPGALRVFLRICIAAHPELTITVSPFHELRKVAPEVCLNERCLPQAPPPGRAVEVKDLVRLNPLATNPAVARPLINHQTPAACDTAFPHPTSSPRRMRRHAATRR